MKCPHCGFSMDNNSTACPVCGYQLNVQPVNQPQQPTQQIPQQPMQQMPQQPMQQMPQQPMRQMPQQPMQQMPQQPMQQMPQQPMRQMPQQPRYPSQPLVDHNTPHMPPDPVKPRNKGVVIAIAIIVAAVIAAGAVISVLSALFYRKDIISAFSKNVNSISDSVPEDSDTLFADDYESFIDTKTHDTTETVKTDWADIKMTAAPETQKSDGKTQWRFIITVTNTSSVEYTLYDDIALELLTDKNGEYVDAEMTYEKSKYTIEANSSVDYMRTYLIPADQTKLYANFMITLKNNKTSGMYHIDTGFKVTNYNTSTEPATTQPATKKK